MIKKDLWTINIVKGKLKIQKGTYNVNIKIVGDNNRKVVNVTQDDGSGQYNLPVDTYKRVYGYTPFEVIFNRRKWLIETSLPRKMKELNSTMKEIELLSEWINAEKT